MIQHSLEDWLRVGINPTLSAQLVSITLPDSLQDASDFQISFAENLWREGDYIILGCDEFDDAVALALDGSLWLLGGEKPEFIQSGIGQFFDCERAYEHFLSQPPIDKEWSEERDFQEGQILREIISDIDPRAAEESVLWAFRIEEFTEGVLARD